MKYALEPSIRMRIGFFDSGLGGLTILGATAAALPQYEYLYYGDTAHVPYGDRTEEEIYELTQAGVAHLFAQDCALVVLACNTASAETLRKLQDTYLTETYPNRRILGVVIPTIEELVQSGSRRALMIATKRTVESRKYEKELALRNITQLSFTATATPALVPLIEAGEMDAATTAAIETIEATDTTVDTIVLGCTHYALIKEGLRAHFGAAKHIISQDELIPRKLAGYLVRHTEIETLLGRSGTRDIYLTDERPSYVQACDRILAAQHQLRNARIYD